MNSDGNSSGNSIRNWAVNKGFLRNRTGNAMRERVDENSINQSDVSSSAVVGGPTNSFITIIRKDPNNKDPPILLEHVDHALLWSPKLHFSS